MTMMIAASGPLKIEAFVACSMVQPASLLEGLSARQLLRMGAAAQELANCHRVLAKTKDNVVSELICEASSFVEWDHYPSDDVLDSESHSQYYYHTHPPADRPWNEHGHFHTFLRSSGMPEGVMPLDLPEPGKTAPEDRLCHLVAISIDEFGLPVRLFATNRWVTGDSWYSAADMCGMIERFSIDQGRPWVANRWITAVLRLFEPQIHELLRERDRRMTAWQESHPERLVFEDRELEIVSSVPIRLLDHISALGDALTRRGLGLEDLA